MTSTLDVYGLPTSDFLATKQQGSSSALSASGRTASSSTVSNNSSAENIIIEEKRRKASGDGYTVHRYLRGRMLGKGGFAKVYLCTALDTSKTYAVKIVPKANLVKARARQKLQAEIKIHRTLRHKNVCEYKHYFEDRDNCYILLELCHNQSLNEMIKRRKRITEPEAAFFMQQLLEAVWYMHEINVIHRDLKLGNLFLDRNMNIKVGDLGLATRVEDKEEKRKTICGTPNYIAPEVIQGDKATRGHSFEVDIWSMGVILYTVLVGKPPYEAKDVKATYQRILANEYSFPASVEMSKEVKDLISRMLQSNPQDRPSLAEISAHPFLSDKLLPDHLPASCLHSAPEWRLLDSGELITEEELATRDKQQRKSLGARPLTSRMPFGSHHPNTSNANSNSTTATGVALTKKDHNGTDFQRIMKTAFGMSKSCKTRACDPTSTISGSTTTTPARGFKIFDDNTVPSDVQSRNDVDDIVARTKAMSLRTASRFDSSNALSHTSPPVVTSVPSAISECDMNPIHKMLDQLETVLSVTESRRSMYGLQLPRPVSSSCGPNKWVVRYVDYTSKYGLGFLLNDGASGVYFNDSTKVALQSEGEHFQYLERQRSTDSRRVDLLIENYTLSCYPDNLKKKVTLLKHFRDYLIEQQTRAFEEDYIPDFTPGKPVNFVYITKWLRTKHAILFRMSDNTVQVVFYDQSEVVLTPDERFVTYVDKNRVRKTYHLTDELVGSYSELEKRIKYTKEILSQLLSSGRR